MTIRQITSLHPVRVTLRLHHVMVTRQFTSGHGDTSHYITTSGQGYTKVTSRHVTRQFISGHGDTSEYITTSGQGYTKVTACDGDILVYIRSRHL